MIEIYLFVNPLGVECFQAERQILRLVEAESQKKIQFRFVPFVNMHVVDRFMKIYNLPKGDLALRNEIFQTFYNAALDYKTLQLQGKKKGRSFLLQLQKLCGIEKLAYEPKLVDQLVTAAGGDLEEFHHDRSSLLVKEAFLTDQQIAHDMSIVQTPSVVVYNYASGRDFGVLLTGDVCKEFSAIARLCNTEQEELRENLANGHQRLKKNHLHLV